MTIRLGLLVPSSNTTMEPEFYAMKPASVTVHAARMRIKRVTLEGLTEMERGVEEAAQSLADAKVDVIGYGCTSGSLIRGLGHDREIVSKIERGTGTPAIATSGAVVDALRALHLEKISVATPYIDSINSLEKRFLEDSRFRVLELKGLGIEDNPTIGAQKPGTILRLARTVNRPEAQGVFISCTNLPTIGVVQKLEKDLKKPVVSSNTATLWAMLRKVGFKGPIEGYGRILLK